MISTRNKIFEAISSDRKAKPAFFIIVLAPGRDGDLDPDLSGHLSEYSRSYVLVLVDRDETAVQAAQQGLQTIMVDIRALEGPFVSQVRECAGLMVDSGILSFDSQAVFLSKNNVRMGLKAFARNREALATLAGPSLFVYPTPAPVHPLRLKTGFALIDLDLQVQVLTAKPRHWPTHMPAGQLQTSDFPLSWSSYGIHKPSGYAGMVRASHQGTSFAVEEHVTRCPADFDSPILLHYQIRGPKSARRYVAAQEVSCQTGTLPFVPAYQKADGASMLFIHLEDDSTAVFVDATLANFNLVLLLYPDVAAEFCEKGQTLGIPSVAMKDLEPMSHMDREYLGPFRLNPPPACKNFLAVLLARNCSGDVDMLHHIPMQTALWSYDPSTNEVLVQGGRKIYGRQTLPDIHSPLIAAGTAMHLQNLSTKDVHMVPLDGPDYMDNGAMPFVPCPHGTNAPGFLSEIRNRTVKILEMETGITPITPDAVANYELLFRQTLEELCRHKMIITVKDMLLDQLVSEAAEMPLTKILNLHIRYVNQAWPFAFEMLGNRLPALGHALKDKSAKQSSHHTFKIRHRFGSGIVKRPLDVMPSTDGKTLWVTDCDAACIWGFDQQGTAVKKIENGLKSPRYFIADNKTFHISDPFAQKMFTLLASGKIIPSPVPMQVIFQGQQFWPVAGYIFGDQYLLRAMNSERNIGVFLCDKNDGNTQILLPAQPSLYCLDVFDADEQKMVLTGSNEPTLYMYTFATKEWQSFTLLINIPNITGLSLAGDCVLIKSPPQVLCYNLVTSKIRFKEYIPELIGHGKWPFNAFRASTDHGQTTLYINTIDNDIAVIDLGKLN